MFKFFKIIFFRLYFIYKFKSFKKLLVLNNQTLVTFTSQGIYQIPRRCPHQGAFLENAFKKDNLLICNWHGCKINIFYSGKNIKF
jgi:nitrite reductase/ring-hydroxylating ferredoxin subunit